MKFTVLPVLDTLAALYATPRDRRRFERYLELLQGKAKAGLVRPIGGYNPMGNELVAEKINNLRRLDAETIMAESLLALPTLPSADSEPTIQVALNVADDVGGAWSQRYLTDYSSKFDLRGLVNRGFCAPFVWTSEAYSPELIAARTRAYALRTYYYLVYGGPKTLAEHLAQEGFVSKHADEPLPSERVARDPALRAYLKTHHATDNYNFIFGFLYGDAAARAMSYPAVGLEIGALEQ